MFGLRYLSAAGVLLAAHFNSCSDQMEKMSKDQRLRRLLMCSLLGIDADEFLAGPTLQRQETHRQEAQTRHRLDEQRDEYALHEGQLAAIAQEMSKFHDREHQNQELVDQKNDASIHLLRALTDTGGTPAQISIDNDIHYDGVFSPQDLAGAFIKDQPILHGPAGSARHFIEIGDLVHVIDLADRDYHKRLHRSGCELNILAGCHLVPGDRTYTLSLGSIVTLYLQNLRSLNARAAKTHQLV
jgi:hypothetical protein